MSDWPGRIGKATEWFGTLMEFIQSTWPRGDVMLEIDELVPVLP
jgi:hypothetical protein